MHPKHQIGVFAMILAVVLGYWSFERFVSLTGHLKSWEFPLSEFQAYTVVGVLSALFLLIVGLRLTSFKPTVELRREE